MAFSRGRFVQTAVVLDPEMLGQIDTLAEERRVSRADVMRELFRLGLERYEHQQAILRAAESVNSPMLVKSA